jgi:hypothetical protein
LFLHGHTLQEKVLHFTFEAALAIGQHIRNLPDMYFLTYALMYELAHPDSFWKIPLQFVSFDLPKLTLFDSTQTMLNTYHEFDFPYKDVMLEFWRVVEHDFTEIERHLSAAYPLYANHGWDKFRSCLKYVYSHSIGGTSIVPGVELLNCHLKGSDEETPMRKILGRSRSDMSPDSSGSSLSKRVSVGRLMRSLGHRFDNSCTKKADSDYAAGEEIKFMYAAVPDVLNLFFWGFLHEENPFNCVSIAIGLSPTVKGYREKTQFFGRYKLVNHLGEHQFEVDQSGAMPGSTLAYLRVAVLDNLALLSTPHRFFTAAGADQQNNLKAYAQFVSICSELLGDEAGIGRDEHLLAQNPGEDISLLVKERLARKKLLCCALKKATEEMGHG